MNLFNIFKKKPPPENPPEKPLAPVPGYSYWDYRSDLFNPSVTLDAILSRLEGDIRRRPRYPKEGEVWEFRNCILHGSKELMYPSTLRFDPLREYWPFINCGCLYFLHDGKKGGST